MNKVRLVTESWETEEEISKRTETTLDVVRHALKSLWKDGYLSCLWPDSDDKPMHFRLRNSAAQES